MLLNYRIGLQSIEQRETVTDVRIFQYLIQQSIFVNKILFKELRKMFNSCGLCRVDVNGCSNLLGF